MNLFHAVLYGFLVALFSVPVVFTNVPQHAVTQSMLVVLGLMVATNAEELRS